MDMKESVIAADITIEGKIVGSGHVRIAGRFKGDVHVDGNLTLDSGAHLEGQVKASVVVVGGELLGNIDNAKRVELLETGVTSRLDRLRYPLVRACAARWSLAGKAKPVASPRPRDSEAHERRFSLGHAGQDAHVSAL